MGREAQAPRKRRWHDSDNTIFALYHQDEDSNYYSLNQHQSVPSRKIMPLTKRTKLSVEDHALHVDHAPTHRRRLSQQRALQDMPDLKNRSFEKPVSLNLAPCHVCHRRPTKKSDLDSFAECQGCGERTCFVCIRQCQGKNIDDASSILSEQEVLSRSFHMEDVDDAKDNCAGRHNLDEPAHHHAGHGSDDQSKGWDSRGHQSVVCSRCCVEKGEEGEVVCLGCLSGMDLAE